jgi:hypothetical protein
LLHELFLVIPCLDFLGLVLKFLLHELLSDLVLLLEFLKLVLCDLFGMLGVVGKELKLVEVMLLSLETLLNGCQLVLIAHSFILKPLDNHFIGLSDALGFVVLDHCLVKLVLQHSNLSHLRIVLRVKVYLNSINFFLFVLFQIIRSIFEFLGQGEGLISFSSPVV